MPRPAVLFVSAALLALLPGCRTCQRLPHGTVPATARADAEAETRTGTFHVVYDAPGERYFLGEEGGAVVEIFAAQEALGPHGGASSLDRRRVRVRGAAVREPRAGFRATSIEPLP